MDKKKAMKIGIGAVLVVVIIGIIIAVTTGKEEENDTTKYFSEEAALNYMNNLNEVQAKRRSYGGLMQWNYESNITEYNEQIKLNASVENAKLDKRDWRETIKYDWKNFKDPNLKRMFKMYSDLGTAALESDEYELLEKALSHMQTNYATTRVCDFNNKEKCDLNLEPEITEIFAKSNNPEELKFIWKQWYDGAGTPAKKDFIEYVKYVNKAAKLNGYDNNAESWLDAYEKKDFEKEMDLVWEQMQPLYLQLHAYVRRQLYNKYGPSVIDKEGPIPAHLLGNVWAQGWENLESFTQPYPSIAPLDVTNEMVKQGYTPKKMFELADEFFQSINLTAMPPKFWKNSIIEKPADGRDLICHASAWDMYNEDVRIKMCTMVTMGELKTVHHEMGHIEYYLLYESQPSVYRGGANPGFHEAIGDTIALSVSSPTHLYKINLLKELEKNDMAEINNLYSKALDKIAFLPFAMLLDKYRYAIFRGETTPEDFNCHFWRLKESYQGVEPPLNRTEENFDAAAKYHVSADVEYARYFVSFIIQFQFHRALCQKAGQYDPNNEALKLTDCDIYQNADAGNALKKMLSMGSSKPWPDAMETLTGERDMNASGILEYFKPLQAWLEKENKKTNEYIGWKKSKVGYCTADQLQKVRNSP